MSNLLVAPAQGFRAGERQVGRRDRQRPVAADRLKNR